MISKRNQTKNDILYHFSYIKFPEKANCVDKKVTGCLVLRSEVRINYKWHKGKFKVILDSGDFCTSINL